jgi:hypothetical protein
MIASIISNETQALWLRVSFKQQDVSSVVTMFAGVK